MSIDWIKGFGILLIVVCFSYWLWCVCTLKYDGACDYSQCDSCPFPCEKHGGSIPVAYYTVTSIKNKTNRENPIHNKMLGRKAYVVYLAIGERGFIKYLPDFDDRYHCLYTSTVLNFTPWENGEDTITIETVNTEYVLTKQ